MKIALVILHADPARGGAERYTVDLSAALVQRGHEVDVLAQTFDRVPPGVLSVPMPSAATRAMSYRRFLSGVDAHVRAQGFDIVHAMLPVRRCDVYHPHAGMAAEAMRKGNRFFNPRRRAMAHVERKLLSGPDVPVVLSLSEYVKGLILRHYPLPPEKLVTLFNAVDLNRFDPATRPEARAEVRSQFELSADAVVGLMVAQDLERKGLREFIAAMPLAADPRLVALVVGKEDPSPYIAQARRLGVAGRVLFAGPTADPFRFYAAADAFVLPTRHDPCSLVVLEALAMGVPVISTIFNGATEIMTDGVHGFVLNDPTDVDALAAALRTLLDPERRRRMSQACLDLRPRLSYDTHLDRLIEIYRAAR